MAGRPFYLLIFLMLVRDLNHEPWPVTLLRKQNLMVDSGTFILYVASHLYIDIALVADICQAEATGTIATYLFLRLSNCLWLLFLTPSHNVFLTG
jgi:hypothetical protein